MLHDDPHPLPSIESLRQIAKTLGWSVAWSGAYWKAQYKSGYVKRGGVFERDLLRRILFQERANAGLSRPGRAVIDAEHEAMRNHETGLLTLSEP